MKKIICMSGKQYSGKDTVAKILLNELKDFERMAIGDAIKLEYGKIHNLTYDVIDSNKGKYRTGLIELGNKGRSIDPDYWLKKIINTSKNIIVTDVRMLHEADVFKKAGAYLIRVEASYETRAKRGVITNVNDSTEVELDCYQEFDYVIKNDADYETLIKNVKPLIDILRVRFT